MKHRPSLRPLVLLVAALSLTAGWLLALPDGADAHGVPSCVVTAADGSVRTSWSGAALTGAIAAAEPGDRLVVRGRCRGRFRIERDLVLVGRPRAGDGLATLVGASDAAVVDVAPRAHVVLVRLRLTHDAFGAGRAARGLRNQGVADLVESEVTGNRAARGGGVLNAGRLRIVRSTVHANRAAVAGGGVANDGRLLVRRSTIVANASDGDGGGIDDRGRLRLEWSTVSDNTAAFVGGGVAVGPVEAGAGASFVASIVVANQAGASGPDCAGEVTSQGYNLVGTTDGFFCAILAAEGDLIDARGDDGGFVDPGLGAFGWHGGPTPTVPLLGTSPVIDRVPVDSVVGCGAGERDQRGVAVPSGVACDSGAFELVG